MTKQSAQKRLIQSGVAVLVATPFVAYFGSKAFIAGTCDFNAPWSFCSVGEVPLGLLIGLTLCLIGVILLAAGVMKNK